MAKRSRFKEVIKKGYDRGIWQSAIIHELVFIILILIAIDVPAIDRITPISLSFSDPKPVLTMEPVLSLDFDSVDKNIEESIASNSSTISEIFDAETPKLVQEPELETQETPQSTSKMEIADIDPKDLVSELVTKVEDEKPTLFDKKPSKSKVNKKGQSQQVTSSNTGNALTRLIRSGTTLGDGIPRSLLGMGNGLSSGGKAGDAEARLKFYGAKTGDIQISLIWNTVDDIDLHVSDGVQIISWKRRRSVTGGMLDIDMNARGPQSNKPIENIFWPFNTAPRSHYVVAVHFFRAWTNNRSVPVKVRIKTNKGVSYYDVVAKKGAGIQQVIQFSN